MKILFADKFPDAFAEILVQRGHEIDYQPELGADDLAQALSDHDILVVRSTKVTADALASASNLKMVIRAGAGTNTIDKAAARERDIHVCNVPGKNAVAVAELTLGLLIALDRRIADNVMSLRNGKWDKKTFSVADGLFGKSMGIVGLGSIGLAVAERAVAFGLQVKALRKSGRSAEQESRIQSLGFTYTEDLAGLARECDILSFHVPAAADTKALVNQELLAELKPGAIILNTSRGDIIDESALISAMNDKGLRAGLDVYADEPASGQSEYSSALAQHTNVYGTHHIGASTSQAQSAVSEGVVDIIDAYTDGKVLNCVNA